jgi:spermidine/putrescine transport system permease protein
LIGAKGRSPGTLFGLGLSVVPGLWLAAFFMLPLAVLVAWSFQPPGISTELRSEWTLDAYRLTLGVSSYWSLLAKTFLIAAIVAVVAVALAYPIAYTLAQVATRHRYLLLGLALLPFLTSYLLRIFAWRLLLGTNGVLNGLLQGLGLIDQPVGFFLFSRTAVIIVLIYVWVPWAALPIFLRLEQMDKSLLEASADLGASNAGSFWRVTFPLSLPGVYASFFFVFIPTLGDFATASAVGGAEGQMIGNVIQHFLNSLSYPSGAVLTILVLIAALLTMFVAVRVMRIGEISGLGR